MLSVNDVKLGKMYWGAMPLPQGAELIGVADRGNGEVGAAIKMPTGRIMQGNAGTLRSFDCGDIPKQ